MMKNDYLGFWVVKRGGRAVAVLHDSRDHLSDAFGYVGTSKRAAQAQARIINRNLARMSLNRAVEIAAHLWRKACDFDSIPLNESFVHFSRYNPYSQAYNRAMTLIINLKRRVI